MGKKNHHPLLYKCINEYLELVYNFQTAFHMGSKNAISQTMVRGKLILWRTVLHACKGGFGDTSDKDTHEKIV